MRSAYAVRRPVANEYLVRERDRRRNRELAMVLLAALLVGGGLLAYVSMQVEMMRIGYQVEVLERRLAERQRIEGLLSLEAAHLERPEQVERRAIEELGMTVAELDQLVFESELP